MLLIPKKHDLNVSTGELNISQDKCMNGHAIYIQQASKKLYSIQFYSILFGNSHNVLSMQLTLLFYSGLCNSSVFKVVKVAGCVKLCVCTKTRASDEKSDAHPMKAKSTRISFQLSFALKDSPASYWFFFLLPTFSGQLWYSTYFDKLLHQWKLQTEMDLLQSRRAS